MYKLNQSVVSSSSLERCSGNGFVNFFYSDNLIC
jgi:hypothetical protein